MDRVLVAIDGSDQGYEAVDLAADIAAKFGARLLILTVMPRGEMPELLAHFAEAEHITGTAPLVLQKISRQVLELAGRRAAEHGDPSTTTKFEEGDPVRAILDTARKEDVDLIVLGSRGMGRLQGLMLGSVSQKVLQLADCPCLIVR